MPIAAAFSFSLYRPAAWLKVAGGDAETFLQGQFSNDLRGLTDRGAAYGLWLNHKGKVLADSFILRAGSGEGFWVGSPFSPAPEIGRRLEGYIVADDVAVEDVTSQWAGAAILGEGAEAAARSWAGPEDLVFRGCRTVGESAEWIFPAAATDRARQALAGARELPPEALERLRIEAGIPAVPADIGPGDLPQEGALETSAVSFDKGCYLGQEVMARLKSKGRVRRQLMRVKGPVAELLKIRPEAGSPKSHDFSYAKPTPLWQEDRQVGELRSAVPDGATFIGLALLVTAQLHGDAPLAFSPHGAPTVELIVR